MTTRYSRKWNATMSVSATLQNLLENYAFQITRYYGIQVKYFITGKPNSEHLTYAELVFEFYKIVKLIWQYFFSG